MDHHDFTRPYAAPKIPEENDWPTQADDGYLGEARVVLAGRAIAWFRTAWLVFTSSTMHCEDCWRAGHHAAGGPLRHMLLPVLLLALAALAATLLESVSGPVPAYAMLAVGFSWIMAAMVAAARKANAAARNLHPENQHPDAQLPR